VCRQALGLCPVICPTSLAEAQRVLMMMYKGCNGYSICDGGTLIAVLNLLYCNVMYIL